MTDSTTLRMERTYQAPARAVFDAVDQRGVIRRWWHAAHDWETTEAVVDLRVGGVVRVVMRNPHEDVEYGGGTYTEIDPPTRLAFTRIWDCDTTRQLIELDCEEADGVTTVHFFTHSGLWDEEAVRSHRDGWGKAFDNLERTLEAARPGR